MLDSAHADVREGHLVDYDMITVRSNVRINGIFLKEGEQVGVVNPESGAQQLDLLEDEREFDRTKIEREISSPDSNKKTLEEVKKWAENHEKQYGRYPKTLIFAANDLPHTSHADQVVKANEARRHPHDHEHLRHIVTDEMAVTGSKVAGLALNGS
jgi:type I restriction enzyme R subunit